MFNTQTLLETLIGFDTTSHKSNDALISWVENYLDSYGIQSMRVADPTASDSNTSNPLKSNLYATIGPTDQPGIMLSGHTDVVPVAGQDWSSDPFVLREDHGRLFGRGTADMKGFIASTLAAVPTMVEKPLTTPLHLALSFDEEVGCLGVRHLLTQLQQLPVKPALTIVGEPTSMTPVVAHKGKQAFSVQVAGLAGHSAYTTEGINAIDYAAKLITFINQLHQQRAQQGPFASGYRVNHTTLHVGTVTGGKALNIIPELCEFKFEIRHVPCDKPDDLIDAIKQEAARLTIEMQQRNVDGAAETGIQISQLAGYPALSTDEEDPAVHWIRLLLDSNQPVQQVSFGTEGGLFSQELGVTTIVCGPGDIAQAHKPDEYIEMAQLDQCDVFLERLIDYCRQQNYSEAIGSHQQ